MTANSPPPVRESIAIAREDSKFLEASPAWVEFFSNTYEGDPGRAWTPEFTGLTNGGSADISGVYSQINQNLVFFSINIVPTAGVSAVAGTTYAEGFPLQFLRDTACFTVSGGLGGLPGHVVSATNRIYIAALSTVTVPIAVVGIGLAS